MNQRTIDYFPGPVKLHPGQRYRSDRFRRINIIKLAPSTRDGRRMVAFSRSKGTSA
jgi:hypothetical protein